jgi:hypothetical protein
MALTDEQRLLFDELEPHTTESSAQETPEEARQRAVSGFLAVCQLEGVPLPSREDVLAEMDARLAVG